MRNVTKQVENVHARKTLSEISVPSVPLNSGDFQIAKLVRVILRVLKTIFAMLILATVIANEALKAMIAKNVSKDSLDFLHVKHAVVTKKEPLVPLVMTLQENVPVDPTLPEADVINALLDLTDSQTVNLAYVTMMVQEISLVMTTMENVLAKLT